MSEFRRPSPEESGEPTEPRFTRRRFLKTALVTGLAAGISTLPDFSPRPASAEALDGDQPNPDAEQPLVDTEFNNLDSDIQRRLIISNKEAFERNGVENMDKLVDSAPKYLFSDRAVTNLALIDHPQYGMMQTNIANLNDVSDQLPNMGIISPLVEINVDGVKTKSFTFTGTPLGATKMPYKSSIPGFHEEHGELSAIIGMVGIATGRGDQMIRAGIPVFLFLSGEDPNIPYPMRFADRSGSTAYVIDGDEASRNEYTSLTTDEVMKIFNDGIGRDTLAMKIGAPYTNDTLIDQVQDLGYETDTMLKDFTLTQSKYVERYYTRIMQRLALTEASNDPEGKYTPLTSTPDGQPIPIPFSEFSEYIEDVDEIKKRIPGVESVFKKEFVTAEDLVKFAQPLLIDYSKSSSQ